MSEQLRQKDHADQQEPQQVRTGVRGNPRRTEERFREGANAELNNGHLGGKSASSVVVVWW